MTQKNSVPIQKPVTRLDLQTVPAWLQFKCAHYANATAMTWPVSKNSEEHDSEPVNWQSMTYREFSKRVLAAASGFLDLGIAPKDHVAIMATNSPEWAIADFALSSIGAVVVPIYPTLHPKTVTRILKDSDARAICLGGEVVWEEAAQWHGMLKPDANWLTIALDGYMFSPPNIDAKRASELGFSDGQLLSRLGHHSSEASGGNTRVYDCMEQIDPDDLQTIIYTSGTTGEPKGVMYTHQAIVNNVLATERFFEFNFGKEIYLSFLPMAHIYERHCQYAMYTIGANVHFSRGLEHLGQDIVHVAPTLFVAVPRVFEKLMARVEEKVEAKGWFTRTLFRWARRVGTEAMLADYQHVGHMLKLYLARLLVLSKIRKGLSKRLRFIISGGAPLDHELAAFLGAAEIVVAEGYGFSEGGILACNDPKKVRYGTIGKAYPEVDVRISDESELMVRCNWLAKGYYKNEEATREVFDDEGWLATGDLATMDGDFIIITGRKKEMIATAGGKKVMPQKVEHLLLQQGWIEQVCLIGDRRKFLVALIVPSVAGLKRLAKKCQIELESSSVAQAAGCEALWPHLEDAIEKLNSQLSSFETIKRFALLVEGFTEENMMLTPTQKVRRKIVLERYDEVVEKLYGDQHCVLDPGIPLLPRQFEAASTNTDG